MKKAFFFVLFSIFYFLFSYQASAAILYSAAANQDVYEGQTFVVDWYLDTEGVPINALDLKLNFSADFLEVDASPGNSLFSLWIKYPATDNQNGLIELTGGIPNGINHKQIPVFHSVFKALKPGTASISLNPDSQILLNDGKGTAEALKFKNELFNIYPKEFIPSQISSITHPDQNTWYKNRDVAIKFTKKPGEDYSYSFSSNIDIIPDNQKHEVPEVLSYPGLPDGIYYFKLNSQVPPSTWKEAGVFRVQIDATPPEKFHPLIASDPTVFSGRPFISFSTVDKTSGISHYKVKVGLFGRAIETQNPYKLPKPLVGDTVEVTAFDRAGNSTTQTVAWHGYLSVNQFKWLLILIGLAAVAFYIMGRRNKTKDQNMKQNEENLA